VLLGGENCGTVEGFEDITVHPERISYNESSESVRVELRNSGEKNVTVQPLDIKMAHRDRESELLMNSEGGSIENGTTEVFHLDQMAEVSGSDSCNSFDMEIQYDKPVKVNFRGIGEVTIKAEIQN